MLPLLAMEWKCQTKRRLLCGSQEFSHGERLHVSVVIDASAVDGCDLVSRKASGWAVSAV
jgi:hypothetical protein